MYFHAKFLGGYHLQKKVMREEPGRTFWSTIVSKRTESLLCLYPCLYNSWFQGGYRLLNFLQFKTILKYYLWNIYIVFKDLSKDSSKILINILTLIIYTSVILRSLWKNKHCWFGTKVLKPRLDGLIWGQKSDQNLKIAFIELILFS